MAAYYSLFYSSMEFVGSNDKVNTSVFRSDFYGIVSRRE